MIIEMVRGNVCIANDINNPIKLKKRIMTQSISFGRARETEKDEDEVGTATKIY